MSVASLFNWVLDASWQGSLAILLLLAIRPLLGARIPARWRALLWLLVLVRLVMPTFALPRMPAVVPGFPALPEKFEVMTIEIASEGSGPEVIDASDGVPLSPASDVAAISDGRRPAVTWLALSRVAAVVWLVGALAVAGYFAFATVLFYRRVGKTAEAVPEIVLEAWRDCCSRMSLRRPLKVVVSEAIDSPALIGVWRPRLLIPRLSFLSPEDWEHVFLHELAHYRRGDHWTNLLQLAAMCVHWFNPLVWLGMRGFRADRELAADEWALRRLDGERVLSYGETLLRVLSSRTAARMVPGAVGIMEDGRQMKQRLRRIAAFRPPRLWGSAIGFALILALAAVVLGRQGPKAEDAGVSSDGSAAPIDAVDLQEQILAAARAGDGEGIMAVILRSYKTFPRIGEEGAKTMLDGLARSRELGAFTVLLDQMQMTNLGKIWQPDSVLLAELVKDNRRDFIDVLLARRLSLEQLSAAADGADGDTRAWIARRVEEVRTQRADQDALVAAAGKGDIETIRRLLDAGVDVNCVATDHHTPLTLAARQAQTDAVRLLLARGGRSGQAEASRLGLHAAVPGAFDGGRGFAARGWREFECEALQSRRAYSVLCREPRHDRDGALVFGSGNRSDEGEG